MQGAFQKLNSCSSKGRNLEKEFQFPKLHSYPPHHLHMEPFHLVVLHIFCYSHFWAESLKYWLAVRFLTESILNEMDYTQE